MTSTLPAGPGLRLLQSASSQTFAAAFSGGGEDAIYDALMKVTGSSQAKALAAAAVKAYAQGTTGQCTVRVFAQGILHQYTVTNMRNIYKVIVRPLKAVELTARVDSFNC